MIRLFHRGSAPAEPVGDPDLALDVRELSHTFGRDLLAVDRVTLRVEPGEIFGLLGADGAGKSTLIRMLATVLRPGSGDAFVLGHSVTREARAVKPRIGYMSQRFSLYPDLTVAENLSFFARLRGVAARDIPSRAKRLLEFAGLTEFSGRVAENLSGGMKQKLALAVTLIHEPDVLFLDEPTTGVDPVSRREFWRIIAQLHRDGITAFVATPYMDEAERCSHIAFMDNGRVLLSDTPAALKARIPGTLYEIALRDQRAAVALLAPEPFSLSTTVFGDRVRIIVARGGPGPDGLRDRLEAGGVFPDAIEPIRPDMEATFAYLAEEARRDAAAAAAVEADDKASDDAAGSPADSGVDPS